MSATKVLTFGWEFAPIVAGGLGVVCRDLTEHLAKKGLDISFVLPKFPREIDIDFLRLINASETEVDQTIIKYIDIKSLLLPYSSADTYTGTFSSIKKKLSMSTDTNIYGWNLFEEIERYAFRAIEIASKEKPDIIHAHDWMTFKAAINAKKVTGAPLVVHIHATEFDRSGGNPYQEIYEYEKVGLNAADKIIAVSSRTKNTLIHKYDISPDKIEVVHNAVHHEVKEMAPIIKGDGDEKMVLFLGRLSIQKGAEFLLKAAKKVLAVSNDVKFVFVGKGDMLKELIDKSIDYGISKNVIFTGFLSHDEVDRAYKYANLFVMPSVSEPFGITALEAIRNGTPVLMSKQSGASEVVQNALKVDFWDVDEMASKILAVLQHPILASTLSLNGYHDLERISWDNQAGKVIDIYNNLLH